MGCLRNAEKIVFTCFLCCEKIKRGWNSREVVGWGGKEFMRWTYHRPTVFNTKQKFSILTYSIQYQSKVFITKAWHNIRAVFMRWTYQPTVGGRGLQGCRYNSLPFSSLCSPTGRLRLLSHWEHFQFYIFYLPLFYSNSLSFILLILLLPLSTSSSKHQAPLKRSLA